VAGRGPALRAARRREMVDRHICLGGGVRAQGGHSSGYPVNPVSPRFPLKRIEPCCGSIANLVRIAQSIRAHD
jgi:hypothetical protein